MKEWTSFWFEGNLAVGHIQSREGWKEIKNRYSSEDIDLLDARKSIYNTKVDLKSYGFYLEHCGSDTLREFAKRNNMDLS